MTFTIILQGFPQSYTVDRDDLSRLFRDRPGKLNKGDSVGKRNGSWGHEPRHRLRAFFMS